MEGKEQIFYNIQYSEGMRKKFQLKTDHTYLPNFAFWSITFSLDPIVYLEIISTDS